MVGVGLQDLVELGEGVIQVAGLLELEGEVGPEVDVIGVGGQEAPGQVIADDVAVARLAREPGEAPIEAKPPGWDLARVVASAVRTGRRRTLRASAWPRRPRMKARVR